jgi:acyl carrier protein
LPAPDASLITATKEFVAPTTPLEQRLADIWQALLHVDRLGVHDDFFELGGHSLLAMRLASQLRQSVGVAVSLRDLFTASTVAKLAASIEQTPWLAHAWDPVVLGNGNVEEGLI